MASNSTRSGCCRMRRLNRLTVSTPLLNFLVTVPLINGRSKVTTPEKDAIVQPCIGDHGTVHCFHPVGVFHRIHPQKHDRLASDVRKEPAVVRSFEIINPSGAVLVDELHDPLSPLAIVAPEAAWASHLRFIQTKFQAIDQGRCQRWTIQQVDGIAILVNRVRIGPTLVVVV